MQTFHLGWHINIVVFVHFMTLYQLSTVATCTSLPFTSYIPLHNYVHPNFSHVVCWRDWEVSYRREAVWLGADMPAALHWPGCAEALCNWALAWSLAETADGHALQSHSKALCELGKGTDILRKGKLFLKLSWICTWSWLCSGIMW